jgi:L-fucose mutarotase
MLSGKLIHPSILEALGRAGHGSKVLIADGNYPASTTLGMNAIHVPLNLSPGVVSCTEILEALTSAIRIEAASVMGYYREGPYALSEDPPIWDEFRRILLDSEQAVELEELERFAFYEAAAQPDVCLTVQSGDQRIYANLLLTIGVIV